MPGFHRSQRIVGSAFGQKVLRARLMTMHAIRPLPVLCAIVATCLAGQSQRDSRTPPDVFLITIDTLRADHVHCYGYDRIRTPALDALATQGILFAEAFTPSPITNTSHTSILTGLLPS